ncbi:MAG: tRNA 4-thiouridine(8) synthase ThiI [Erysipelotrichaceae bacterium]|jgi:thiamine biosynthesis protein ThiI|nr:tRNA 4-thiouridine(8) synthase ThiI [Erysipelotrichaceae bacterium]
MAYEASVILVRYGELSTKGKNRKDFVNRLCENTKNQLKEFPRLTYEKTYDRLYIRLNGEECEAVSERLQRVFGLSSFSVAIKVESVLEVIAEAVLALAKKETGAKTFKMMARRHDKLFYPDSDGINRHCAGLILANTKMTVDVHHPDLKIIVEVQRDFTYIMAGSIAGAGGFPVGIGGKALLLLSGGIDSPVAAVLTMKRGVWVEAVHFASPPYTSEAALDKVKKLAGILSGFQGFVRLHIVNLTELQLAINQHCDPSYTITILRRMMVRISEKIATSHKCLALVSGESLGQVASQTIQSIQVINEVTNFPILRPCISMDKVEIIQQSYKIGTYETSILPYQDCCTIFTPQNPVTKPTVKKALYQENRFDWQPLLQKALADMTTLVISTQEESKDYL